jgi:TorA maturation chaperone TorD
VTAEAKALTEDGKTLALTAADDLWLVCALQDRELDAAMVKTMAGKPASAWFALLHGDEEFGSGLTLLEQAVRELTSEGQAPQFDALASDYADIYLTFGKRVAPNESYWMTIEHLERQEPMFQVRDWYKRYGLTTGDWRLRPDDHLILEMQFVATLLERATPPSLGDAAQFMDQHLLPWAIEFYRSIAARADTAYYAGVALVSLSTLEAVRTVLTQLTGRASERALLPEDRPTSTEPDPEFASFMPGAAPSW